MLLSIVIPTKNRQNTCMYAIESALAINADDIEIIIQDCSDTNDLEKQIQNKFGSDSRVKYFYTITKPSMTENWNSAFSHATGEYVCGIGDDDAVIPEIYNIASWAMQNNAMAIVHTSPYFYFWPGFTQQKYNGTFIVSHDFSGNIIWKSDYQQRIRNYGNLHEPMSYMDLPAVYHALISQKLINKIVSETGKLLDSTSLDIYTAIAFSKYIDQYAVIDYPFSLKGASPKSNTQRLYTKKVDEHLAEFKNIGLPSFLPKVAGLNITAAESYVKACKNTGRDELIKLIDLPVLYANIALENQDDYEACEKKLNEFVLSPMERERFYKFYAEQKSKAKRDKVKKSFKNFFAKVFAFAYPLYRFLTPSKKSLRVQVFQADTIMDGIHKIHAEYLKKNNISLLK